MAGHVSQTSMQVVSGKSKKPTVVVSLVNLDDYHVNTWMDCKQGKLSGLVCRNRSAFGGLQCRDCCCTESGQHALFKACLSDKCLIGQTACGRHSERRRRVNKERAARCLEAVREEPLWSIAIARFWSIHLQRQRHDNLAFRVNFPSTTTTHRLGLTPSNHKPPTRHFHYSYSTAD